MSPRSASAWSSTASVNEKASVTSPPSSPCPLCSTVASSCSRKHDSALAAETHHIADREPLRRLDQSAETRAVEPFDQSRRNRRLVLAAAEPAAVQIGGKDFRIVDDDGIAAPQQRRQIAHDAVVEFGRRARPHPQKPGGIARRRRPQRDAVLRQGEIEQVRAHWSLRHWALETHIATFGAAGNVTRQATSCAVIQVKPGIGDVIWHLPFIRAIAGVAPGGRVTFLAPPTSHAQELLAAEPAVAETVYFEHAGSELRRGINLIRLAALLRRSKFRSIWILDRTTRPGARREACRHPRAHRPRSRSAKLLHHQSRHRPQPISTIIRSIGSPR